MEIKVVVRSNKRKNKKAPKGAIGFTGAMSVLFFILSYFNQQLFYNGNHSHGVVLMIAIFAGLSGIFLLLFLGLLMSRFVND